MWTLENIVNNISSGLKSLADWGLDDLRFSRRNMDAQIVTCLLNGQPCDAAELFPTGSTVIIRQDDTVWFYGRVDRWSRNGAGTAESQTASIVNPWWYLTKKTFQQNYKSYVRLDTTVNPPVVVYEEIPTAHLWLNLEVDSFLVPTGNLTSVQFQVTEILQYAISQGAPIAIGVIDGADVFPEVEEIKMVTCAEALMKQWRWARDMVLWWDYTTTPYPTVHFRKADNLAAVTVDLNAGTLLESFSFEQLVPVPYVNIAFENANATNLIIQRDFYPNPLPAEKFGGLDIVLDVRGGVTNQTTVKILTEAVDVTSQTWWKEKIKWLADAKVTSFTFVDATGLPANPAIVATDPDETYNSALTNELLPGGGSLPDWLGKTGQSVVAKGWVSVTQKNSSQSTRVPIAYELTITDAASGTFTNNQIVSLADPIPANLARRVWESHQRLGAQGSFTNVETELTGGVTLGNVVNFTTPAQPGWAMLRALVQSVEETVVQGRTSIRFGTLTPLGVNDLSDILRLARARLRLNPITMRSGAAGGGSVGLGKKTPTKNSQAGLPSYEQFNVSAGPVSATGQITLTNEPKTGTDKDSTILQQITGATGDPIGGAGRAERRVSDLEGEETRFRWMAGCMNGTFFKCKVERSAFITITPDEAAAIVADGQ